VHAPDCDERRERYERWEQRLAVPVLVAALASVPAVFLTLAGGVVQTTGNVLNYVSGAVLVAETVVLGVLSEDKRAWVRRHRALLLLTLALLPAVVLALGPVQLLRLLRVVGALRLVRVRRIMRAADTLREHAGLTGWRARALSALAGLLVAVFVAVVLSDPTSQSRRLLDDVVGGRARGPVSVLLVLLAGALLGGASFIVYRWRSGRDRRPGPRQPT
jgi:hypothetical protein